MLHLSHDFCKYKLKRAYYIVNIVFKKFARVTDD